MVDHVAGWSKAFEQASQDAVGVYDQVMVPVIFEPLAELLLDHLGLCAGEQVLDVASGPGSVARLAASRVGPAGGVTACDISPAMLAAGRAKPVEEGAASIRWVESAAMPLAVGDSSFDAVTCQQGLQFFPDRVAALTEMHRALRSSGRLGCVVWGAIEHDPAFVAIVSALRQVFGDEVADRYQTGPWALSDPAELAWLLDQAGFTSATVEERDIPFTFPGGPDQLLGTVLASSISGHFAAVPEEQRYEFITVGRRLLDPMSHDGILHCPGRVNIAVAQPRS